MTINNKNTFILVSFSKQKQTELYWTYKDTKNNNKYVYSFQVIHFRIWNKPCLSKSISSVNRAAARGRTSNFIILKTNGLYLFITKKIYNREYKVLTGDT